MRTVIDTNPQRPSITEDRDGKRIPAGGGTIHSKF
jgi:hypothetical protein